MQKVKSLVAVIFFGIAALGLTVEARATVMWELDGTGKLTGARNVTVNGTLYDVAFVDGTCIDLFDGCDEASDFTFTTQAAAISASQALLDQVFLDTPAAPANFDTTLDLTLGCTPDSVGSNTCRAFTPYVYRPRPPIAFDVGVAAACNTNNVPDFCSFTTFLPISEDLATSDNEVYARWTQSVPVPIPPTAFLFGTGVAALFGLVGIGNRRERQG